MAGSPCMTEALPDLLDHGLILVFCGTAASEVSARLGAYYANPGNAFWQTLHEVGIAPRRFKPQEFRQLLDLQIGLTDLAKQAVGSDRSLRRQDFDRELLAGKLCRFQPQILAFTSKRAWRAWRDLSSREDLSYGWQRERLGATACFVLPSPSGAARGYWTPQPWRDLAAEYQRRLEVSSCASTAAKSIGN